MCSGGGGDGRLPVRVRGCSHSTQMFQKCSNHSPAPQKCTSPTSSQSLGTARGPLPCHPSPPTHAACPADAAGSSNRPSSCAQMAESVGRFVVEGLPGANGSGSVSVIGRTLKAGGKASIDGLEGRRGRQAGVGSGGGHLPPFA